MGEGTEEEVAAAAPAQPASAPASVSATAGTQEPAPASASAPAQPLPVLPYATVVSSGGAAWLGPMVLIGAVVACVACCMVWWEVESVLFSSPVLLCYGVVLLILGVRRNRGAAVLAGGGHIAICLMSFMLINVCNWGPSEATLPLKIIGGTYLAACLPLSVLAWMRLRRRPDGLETELPPIMLSTL